MRHWFRHHWEIVRVTHMMESPWDQPNTTGNPYTLILQRCQCGTVRTIRLDGHWTAADLGNDLWPETVTIEE